MELKLKIIFNDNTEKDFVFTFKNFYKFIETDTDHRFEIVDDTNSKQIQACWEEIKSNYSNINKAVVESEDVVVNITNIKNISYNITFQRFMSEYLIFRFN